MSLLIAVAAQQSRRKALSSSAATKGIINALISFRYFRAVVDRVQFPQKVYFKHFFGNQTQTALPQCGWLTQLGRDWRTVPREARRTWRMALLLIWKRTDGRTDNPIAQRRLHGARKSRVRLPKKRCTYNSLKVEYWRRAYTVRQIGDFDALSRVT